MSVATATPRASGPHPARRAASRGTLSDRWQRAATLPAATGRRDTHASVDLGLFAQRTWPPRSAVQSHVPPPVPAGLQPRAGHLPG
jgi:hypothetical protein